VGKRILITGNEGYIGSVMAPLFTAAGYDVVGIDTGYFAPCILTKNIAAQPLLRKDLRDLEPADLEGFDAVVHLGALSNDPLGNLNAGLTQEINYHASLRLAKLAKAAGVRRFVFSSSCIMYGMSEAQVVDEESPLDPKTEYAASKVKAERAISELADERFSPIFMRNGTIYGLSPHMRFDTVLNNLLGAAVTTGKVTLNGDGSPWRPVVHVQDVARAFMAVLEAPRATVHNQAFNNGTNSVNHRVMELAEIVAGTVPGCKIEVQNRPEVDRRTYKADFSKIARVLPQIRFEWTVREGARELYESFKAIRLTYEDFVSKRFTRLLWLRHLSATGELDENLRWRRPDMAAPERN